MQSTYFEIFIFLAAACLIVPISNRFKLGSVLGYLIAGILIGPFGFQFINNSTEIMDFAEFGVVMMLFLIGLELEPHILWRLRSSILGFGGLQVILSSLAFTGFGLLLGFSWPLSLTVGMALSLSSTALVLQMLAEKKLMNTSMGEVAFSILLFQDIAVIPILIIMPLLASDSSDATSTAIKQSMIAHFPGYLKFCIVISVIFLIIIGGRYLSYYLFRMIAQTKIREIFTAFSLALIVGIALLMQLIGISPALGAFIAGVVLANSEYRRTLEADIEPFKSLLLGLFFISVGMGIDFNLFGKEIGPISLGILILISTKAFIIWFLGRYFNLLPSHNLGNALALSQGGEFAFVLLQFSGALNILAENQIKLLTLIVALSIASTPLIMLWYHQFILPKFLTQLPPRAFDPINEKNPIILAGFGRFGQVVGRFLWAQNLKLTVLEDDPDQINLIRTFGFKAYFGDATRLDLLRQAGAEHAKILIVTVNDVNTSLAIVRLAKESFPHLKLFARARSRQHAYDLHQLGVDYFKRELFDSSLDLATTILIHLGKSPTEAKRKAEQFRQHDEKHLIDSFAFFEDQKTLIHFAKSSREELERILQSDSVP